MEKLCAYCEDNDHSLCDGGWMKDPGPIYVECDCATRNHVFPCCGGQQLHAPHCDR